MQIFAVGSVKGFQLNIDVINTGKYYSLSAVDFESHANVGETVHTLPLLGLQGLELL